MGKYVKATSIGTDFTDSHGLGIKKLSLNLCKSVSEK